ncbi:GNAT family N-acetyltransferase [Streptomyces canus]|uniref:GNAT family N-acetyltransferase n=1 Tax=Streptomyces canus TaxID=58343 RepID=UPI002784A3C1|nr:GNAT family N-acetyltransferase [Streptomyces canus]MDQ0762019.1 GNAT superfamily N-acetyltransferase [Streptomyces canus]
MPRLDTTPQPAAASNPEPPIRHTVLSGEHGHWFEIGPEGGHVAHVHVIQCRSFAWIEEIAVHPAHRGRRLATRLLTAVIAEFGDQDLALSCSAFVSDTYWEPKRPGLNNEQLRAWYGRHGFHGDSGDARLIREASN